MNDQNFYLPASIVIASVILLFAVILLLGRFDSYLRVKAVDDCGKIARYEKNLPEDNAKISYPVGDMYKNCLKDKGIDITGQ